jgi:hypothetical protein
METANERYKRLMKEEVAKYTSYFRVLRKSAKDKANAALQKEVELRKQYWLQAVQARKCA